MQTILQRCPRNSVEQLGQIEEASFFRFAAMPVAVSPALGAEVEAEASPDTGVSQGASPRPSRQTPPEALL